MDTLSAQAQERLQEIAAEMWAQELVLALRNACDRAPHWRAEAEHLLLLINAGSLPELVETR